MNLQTFIQILYEITVRYFTINNLAINASETEILKVPYGNKELQDVFLMMEDGDLIQSKSQVKILGIKFNASNDMSTHVTTLASRVGLVYRKLQPFLSHASVPQRKIILRSKIESIALCGSILFFNESERVKRRYEGILMRINKWIVNESFFQEKLQRCM